MKKILYICSLSIPIGMIDFLITEMPTLSIPEIGVFLGWKSIFYCTHHLLSYGFAAAHQYARVVAIEDGKP